MKTDYSYAMAERIASLALATAISLRGLYFRSAQKDGLTVLSSVLSLIPEAQQGSNKLKLGKSGALGATFLTLEEANAICYKLHQELGSFRTYGQEIIFEIQFARTQLNILMRQFLAVDWSQVPWNAELMQLLFRYSTFIESISPYTSQFSRADDPADEPFRKLIKTGLVPECLSIVGALIRPRLPLLARDRQAFLSSGSSTLETLNKLWAATAKPLWLHVLRQSFTHLPPKTLDLLNSMSDLIEVRGSLDEIFASFAEAQSTDLKRSVLEGRTNLFRPDNFRVLEEWSDLADYLASAPRQDLESAINLLQLFHTEQTLIIHLIQADLIESSLDLDQRELNQAFASMLSALSFATTKLGYSSAQLSAAVSAT